MKKAQEVSKYTVGLVLAFLVMGGLLITFGVVMLVLVAHIKNLGL